MIRALGLVALALGVLAGVVVVQLARDWRRVEDLTAYPGRFV